MDYIEPIDAESEIHAVFDESAIPYRVEWIRSNMIQKVLFGLFSIGTQGEYRLVPDGPADPSALADLIRKYGDTTDPPEAVNELKSLLEKLEPERDARTDPSLTETDNPSGESSQLDHRRKLADIVISDFADQPHLRHLVFKYDKFKGLTKIKDKALVKTLNLEGAGITDLTPLASFTALRKLNLSLIKQIVDLTPLTNLSNLRELDLSYSAFTDLSPLRQMDTLRKLSLWGTEASDYSALEGLVSLEDLSVGYSTIADIQPLTRLTALRQLDLSGDYDTGVEGSKIVDFTPLEKLVSLQELNLWNTRIRDLSPLKNLKDLSSLNLAETHIEDLAPLAQLQNLESLDLSGTRVVDLAPLSQLSSLWWLSLNWTQVKDLEPLRSVLSLEELDLEETSVRSLDPLAQLPQLHNIVLFGAKVPTLAPFTKSPVQRSLGLGPDWGPGNKKIVRKTPQLTRYDVTK